MREGQRAVASELEDVDGLRALLRCPRHGSPLVGDNELRCAAGCSFPVVRGVPRFVGSDSYVSNFSFEWNTHVKTQLDSANGTSESRDRFRQALDFPLEELRGKRVLDLGCGTGRFAEIVLDHGGQVVGVDLSYAVEACQHNLGQRPGMLVVQGDVFSLPVAEEQFDLVYSLGVLHHTPDPRAAFFELVKRVRPGGQISIALYAAYNKAYVAASERLRRITKHLPAKLLHGLAYVAVPLYHAYKLRPVYNLGMALLPISMNPDPYWRVLDTYDWYSPKYQSYHTHPEVFRWFEEAGLTEIKVLEPGISLIGKKPERRL